MEKGKKRLVIFILFCVIVIIAVTWIIKNSEAQYSNWNACKDELINKYTFIDTISISGRGPGAVIGVQLKKALIFKK